MNSASPSRKVSSGSNLQRRTRFAVRLILAITVVVAAVGGVVALGIAQAENRGDGRIVPEAKALPVETDVVRAVDSFDQTRTFTGLLRAARSSELSFERPGRVVTLSVGEGEQVAAGTTLAKLDTANLLAKQRELQAQLQAAKATLRELVAGPRQQTIAVAQARVDALAAQVRLAEANEQRYKDLLSQQAASQQDYDRELFGLQRLAAEKEAAAQTLAELQAGTRQEQLDGQQAMVLQLEAALENVAVDLKHSELKAPFAGTVSTRHLDEGTVVDAGMPVFRVVEQQALEAWIGLPAAQAARVQPGQSHEITVDGQRFGATVQAVLPELDQATRTRSVIWRILKEDGLQAIPGQVARVELTKKVPVNGYWLPTTALSRGTHGLWSVMVVEVDKAGAAFAARRDIEVLYTQDERILVRGTIEDGDRVIVSGTHRIVPGSQVTEVPSDPAAELAAE